MTQTDHLEPSHAPERTNRRPLLIALTITTVFLVVELIGGFLTNSLALVADAGHMLTDVVALALALAASWLARRPATSTRSFGYLRAEILAALFNSTLLIAVTLYIFWEAFQRLSAPPEVDSGPMLLVAVAGLLANAVSAWVLMRGGGHSENLNTRGAFLHVIGDMLGSVSAIAAALIMLATGWYLADPLLSAGIGVLILFSSVRLLRESLEILLEGTPNSIDSEAVRRAMLEVRGVDNVHDLHIWTVTSNLFALSAHIETKGDPPWSETLTELTVLLSERFGIAHVTLQPEGHHTLPDVYRACSIDSPAGLQACRTLVASSRQRDPAAQLHHH